MRDLHRGTLNQVPTSFFLFQTPYTRSGPAIDVGKPPGFINDPTVGMAVLGGGMGQFVGLKAMAAAEAAGYATIDATSPAFRGTAVGRVLEGGHGARMLVASEPSMVSPAPFGSKMLVAPVAQGRTVSLF